MSSFIESYTMQEGKMHMATIYDEARRRLKKEIASLENQLEMCKGLSRAAVLSGKLKDFGGLLAKLESDFECVTPEGSACVVLLGQPFMKGDTECEGIVCSLTALTH